MKFIEKNYRILLLLIPLLSFALHYHIFKLDLIGIHVWRQTETQTVINNFYTGDFDILNPRINDHADTSQLHRMEFPLMQWMIALLYKIFGAHITVTRLSIFVIGMCSVLGMYRLAAKTFGSKGIGALCAWCFNWSPVFYYYTVNPLPDNLALCCGIWCIVFFQKWISSDKLLHLILSGLFLCIATMAKLPVIIYGAFILGFVVTSLRKPPIPVKRIFSLTLVYLLFIIPALIWYAMVIPNWQNGVLKGVFDQKLNHPDLFAVLSGTVISVLPELLVNYGSLAFFLCSLYLVYRNRLYNHPYFIHFFLWGTAIIGYFLFEMNMIDLVHDYYMLPFLPPIFLLVAYGAVQMMKAGKPQRILAIVCLCVLPITAFVRADSRWDEKDPGFNVAYYKYKDELRSLIPPGALCVVGEDESRYILLYYIDRKGWAFEKNGMDARLLSVYRSKGAAYFFVDSKIDEFQDIKALLGEKIFDRGTLRVYKLK